VRACGAAGLGPGAGCGTMDITARVGQRKHDSEPLRTAEDGT